jgi:hypothetical protein
MPILGGTGAASEYAYRSFIVDLPNSFDWTDLYDVNPGREYRSGYVKITGIKSPLPVRVSVGSSYSLISNVFDNNQTVTFDNNKKIEASFDEYSNSNSRFKSGLGTTISDYIRNNQSINLSVSTTLTDFLKTYTTNVSVGKSTQNWITRTRAIDSTPNAFSFTSIGSTTTQTSVESNIITLSGLEPGFSFDSQITSGIGTIVVNNVPVGTSYTVANGDSIKLQTTSSSSFNTQNNIVLKVGTYSTTWAIKTEVENLNITFTPTSFTDVSNLNLGISTDSNQITLSGFSKNSTLPVTLSNTLAQYEVVRNVGVAKTFGDSPINVIDNDKIRLRLTSSSSYSTPVTSNMTVGNTSSSNWTITTRQAPPLPSSFFIDTSGRILILSCATALKDPRTLTKTTGQVLKGTDTCIDDFRWQYYLDLASTTDGYRLAVTTNNSSTGIVAATTNNIRRMLAARVSPLQNSLTNWQVVSGVINLAWDETAGANLAGGDYSVLRWVSGSGFGYYGLSSNPFFSSTSFFYTTANWWILPPGVPDFTVPTPPPPPPSNPCSRDLAGRCVKVYIMTFNIPSPTSFSRVVLTKNIITAAGSYTLISGVTNQSSVTVSVGLSEPQNTIYSFTTVTNATLTSFVLADTCTC